jgi:hypothetical protein
MISGAEQLKELAACVNEIRQADGSIVKEYILNDPKVIEKIKNKLNQSPSSPHGSFNPKSNSNDLPITNNDSLISKYQEVQNNKNDLPILKANSSNESNKIHEKENQSRATNDTCQSVQPQTVSQVQERIRTFQRNLNCNANSTNEPAKSHQSVIDSFLNYNTIKSVPPPPQKPQRLMPSKQVDVNELIEKDAQRNKNKNQFELKTKKGKALHLVITSDCDATESDIEEVKSFFNKNRVIAPPQMQTVQQQEKTQKQDYMRDYNFKSMEISGHKFDTNEQQQPFHMESTKCSVNVSSCHTTTSSAMNHKRSNSVDLLSKSSSLSNLLSSREDSNRIEPTNVPNNMLKNRSNESIQPKPAHSSSACNGLSAYKGLLTTTLPTNHNKAQQLMEPSSVRNHPNPYESIDESQHVNKSSSNPASYRTNSQSTGNKQSSESTRVLPEPLFPLNSTERMSSRASKTRINGNTYTKSNLSTHQKPQFVQSPNEQQAQHSASNLGKNKGMMQNWNKSLNSLDEIGSSGASCRSTLNSNSSTLSNNLRNLQITPEMTEKLLLKLLLQQLASQHVQQQQQLEQPQVQMGNQDSATMRSDMDESHGSLRKTSTVKNRLVQKSSCNLNSLNQFEHLFNENKSSLSAEGYQNSLKKQADAKHSNSERVQPKHTASMGHPLY